MTQRRTRAALASAACLLALLPHAARAQDARPHASGDVDGLVVAGYDADLGFSIAGVTATVPVKPGDRVEKGQVLATLDEKLVQAEAALAKFLSENDAEIRSAESRLEALKSERNPGASVRAAETEIARARFNQERAKRELALIAARWESHRLKAPVDGVVEHIHISPGAVVQPGRPAIRLVNATERSVEANIPSDKAESLSMGKKVTVMLGDRENGLATHILSAELTWLATTLDPENDARPARFRVLTPPANLLPGTHVGIQLPAHDGPASDTTGTTRTRGENPTSGVSPPAHPAPASPANASP